MKEEINLPKNYFPYSELNLCSNKLMNVKIPFLIGETPLLLIGKSTIPLLWLSAKVSPKSQQWKYIVEENRSLNAAVYVDAQIEDQAVQVRVGNVVIVKIKAQSESKAVIDLLDLRPIGLNVFGDSSGLSLSTNRFTGSSMMNSKVAFVLGE
jgi:hypothetical protein